jgi:hypothetical protein
MSTAPAILRRRYDLHGVRVEVHADATDVIDAMDLRLRDFRQAADARAAVTLEFFETQADADPGAPGSASADHPSRPVYDTPYGSLHYVPERDLLHGSLDGVELRCEPVRGIARLRCRAFSGRRLYLATHPLATISMMELLERRQLFSLHAACLATPAGRGVVIAGASGAGKSTLALALAVAGLSFLSDDIVFLTSGPEGPEVRVLGFADTVGIRERAGRLLPGAVGSDVAREGFPKQLHRIEELLGAPAIPSCTPEVLVFPHVAADLPSAIEELDPGDALLRLAPDVLLTHAASTQAHLDAIGALVRQVRCYALRSGRDLDAAVRLVRHLL